MKRLLSLSISSVLGVSTFLSGSANAEKVLTGEVCSTQVHKLTSEIEWYRNLQKAEEAAKAENKLVLWIHMVGKIDGAT